MREGSLSLLGPMRPIPFLAGLAVGLIALSVIGRLVSQTNYIEHFQRFHRYISADSIYYPTASQLRQLARSSVTDGQVLVIVGGSSVMQGVGQGTAELWTDELQQLLGSSFRVLNYADGGGGVDDGGGVAAQMLVRDGYPVIYSSIWDQPAEAIRMGEEISTCSGMIL